MEKIRRICLFGGPGSGKSALAAWLWQELKIIGYNIEYVPEWVKPRAYERRPLTSFDQVYMFAKQMHKEDTYLKNGADYIVSDSPILMIGAYATRNGDSYAEDLINLAKKFNAVYPSVNIFLDRTGVPYKQEGRYEDYAEAVRTDHIIQGVVAANAGMIVMMTKNRQDILDYVVSVTGYAV